MIYTDNITYQPKPTTNNFKDIDGQTFGRLTVKGYLGRFKKNSIWLCECSCGNVTQVAAIKLRIGTTRSCGCLWMRGGKSRPKHGMSHTLEYSTWQGMIQRCHKAGSLAYEQYGNRGITVCAGWRASFISFYADMGKRPSSEHSIDRIDNEKGYWCGHCNECIEKGHIANCRWATDIEQNNNTRSCRLITWHNKTQSLTMWAKDIHIDRRTLRSRLVEQRWSVEKAFTTPTRKYQTS